MSGDIYQQDIKALANAAHGAGKFSAEEKADDRCVTLDNPLCGDRVTMAVELVEGVITGVKYEVRACLLCRAAASAIGESAVGSNAAEIDALTDNLSLMLKEGVQLKEPCWPSLVLFQAVSQHKSRHACVLLPFKALARVVETGSGRE